MAVQDDQRRPAFGLPEYGERLFDALEVVGVADPQHVPVIAEEPRRDILGESNARAALDGDVVVVVDPAEIVDAEMAGQRGRLRADAFHQATVAANRIDVVVENLEAWTVVSAGKPRSGDRHANAGGDPLTQRTGRRLDP